MSEGFIKQTDTTNKLNNSALPLSENALPKPPRHPFSKEVESSKGLAEDFSLPIHKPTGGWGEIANTERFNGIPVLYNDKTRPPQQLVRFLRERYPEVFGVNPHFYDGSAPVFSGKRTTIDPFQTNCAKAVVALEKRFRGDLTATAGPITMAELKAQKTRDPSHVGSEEWFARELNTPTNRIECDNLENAIERIYVGPTGSRYNLYWSGNEGAHVITAIKDELGVVLIDAQIARLSSLTEKPDLVLLSTCHEGDEAWGFSFWEKPSFYTQQSKNK
jgi:hypothetical protein